ncbi:MAG: GxxExxY protein [Terrimonas sp.]|nr:GxxExxY protein [Terrimonas sp.]
MTKKQVTDLSYRITGCAIKVHRALGPGLLESVYLKCLEFELRKNGFSVEKQIAVPIVYDEIILDSELRLDLLVDDCVVVELKALENTLPVHEYRSSPI